MGSRAIAVRVRCRSWEHFVELFSGGLLDGQVFLPAKQALARGTELALTFELPDQSEVALSARVAQIENGGGRNGLWLTHDGLSEADAARVQAKLTELASEPAEEISEPSASRSDSNDSSEPNESDAPDEPEILVGVLPEHMLARPKRREPPLHEQLRALHASLFAITQKDDLGVLGLDPTASAEDIRAAYLELSKRYHPHRQVKLGSPEAQRVATEIYVRVQAAYGRLTGSQRVPQPEGGVRPRTQRSRASLEVSEAASLLNFHQYDAALARLHKVLQAEPEHEGARLWAAVALARKRKALGDVEGAGDAYRRVLELDPEHVEAQGELRHLEAQKERPRAPLLKRLLGKGFGKGD